MKLLALDTSNQPLSVALMDDDQLLAQTTVTVHPKHASYLQPIIESLMTSVHLEPEDLDRVVVADGPGSYTGLRTAVTTAKTLAATLNIDLVGISSIASIAANVFTEGQLVTVLFDGRNDNVFTGLYRIQNGVPVQVIPDQHTAFDQWLPQLAATGEPVVVLGDLANFRDRLAAELKTNFMSLPAIMSIPQAQQIGRLGLNMTPVADINGFVPRYLRLTKAEADWRQQHPEEDSGNYVEKV